MNASAIVMQNNQRPPTVTEYTVKILRNKILDGEYPFGSRLDQQALAEELGTSVIPIRESLRQLEGEGLVRLQPRRGAFVVDLSVDSLREIYLIREALEELAVQQAVPNLSPQELVQLAAVIEEMESATANYHFSKLLDLNRTFHFLIYGKSEMPKLVELIASLWQQSALYRSLYTYLPERTAQALAEHKEIYEACRRADTSAAGKAVRNNVRQTVEGIVQKLMIENNATIQK
jgi:DNA-binding GntR family transcriptional regulator